MGTWRSVGTQGSGGTWGGQWDTVWHRVVSVGTRGRWYLGGERGGGSTGTDPPPPHSEVRGDVRCHIERSTWKKFWLSRLLTRERRAAPPLSRGAAASQEGRGARERLEAAEDVEKPMSCFSSLPPAPDGPWWWGRAAHFGCAQSAPRTRPGQAPPGPAHSDLPFQKGNPTDSPDGTGFTSQCPTTGGKRQSTPRARSYLGGREAGREAHVHDGAPTVSRPRDGSEHPRAHFNSLTSVFLSQNEICLQYRYTF